MPKGTKKDRPAGGGSPTEMVDMPTKVCPLCKRDLPLVLFKSRASDEIQEHCIACVKDRIPTEDQLRDRVRRFEKHQREVDVRTDERNRPPNTQYEDYLAKQAYKLEHKDEIDKFDTKQKKSDYRKREKRKIGSKEYRKYKKDMQDRLQLTEETIRAAMDEQLGICPACETSLYYPETTHYPSFMFRDKGNKREMVMLCSDCHILLEYAGFDSDLLSTAAKFMRKYNAKTVRQ